MLFRIFSCTIPNGEVPLCDHESKCSSHACMRAFHKFMFHSQSFLTQECKREYNIASPSSQASLVSSVLHPSIYPLISRHFKPLRKAPPATHQISSHLRTHKANFHDLALFATEPQTSPKHFTSINQVSTGHKTLTMHPTTLLLLIITTSLSLTTAFPHSIYPSTSHQIQKRHTRHTHISTTGLKTHTNGIPKIAHSDSQKEKTKTEPTEKKPKIEPTNSKTSHTHKVKIVHTEKTKIAHTNTQHATEKHEKEDEKEGEKGRAKRGVMDVLELVRRAVRREEVKEVVERGFGNVR